MKEIFILAVILSFFISSTRGSLNKNKVVIAINCGSESSYKSEETEVTYEQDKYFDVGIASSAGAGYDNDWPDYQDISVYHTERYGKGTSFKYLLPLPKTDLDGHYILVLKFSEVYFNSAGKKVFDIGLGSKKVITDLDIFEQVGMFAPLDQFVEFDIKGKTVTYLDNKISDAISSNNLVVNFLKGRQDNPKVNAIVLVKGSLQDTDYPEYQEYYRNKEKIAKQKEAKLLEKRKKDIEGMIEADEDLDLSKLGQSASVGISRKINAVDPLKEGINTFLSIPYALEAVAISFVAICFIIFSMVIYF